MREYLENLGGGLGVKRGTTYGIHIVNYTTSSLFLKKRPLLTVLHGSGLHALLSENSVILGNLVSIKPCPLESNGDTLGRSLPWRYPC